MSIHDRAIEILENQLEEAKAHNAVLLAACKRFRQYCIEEYGSTGWYVNHDDMERAISWSPRSPK